MVYWVMWFVVTHKEKYMTYAGFWKRVAACFIDGFACIAVITILTLPLRAIVPPDSLRMVSGVLGIGLYLFYFVWMESSPWQATLGKRLLKLKVTDMEGKRISFLRSLGRNLAMYLSNWTLGIGYLMCLWTKEQQCLHDMCAGCLVMEEMEEVEEKVEIINGDIEETKEPIGWH